MTPREWHDYIAREMVEAGAPEESARERAAQVAQVVVAELNSERHRVRRWAAVAQLTFDMAREVCAEARAKEASDG